jgi:hypothetical protein
MIDLICNLSMNDYREMQDFRRFLFLRNFTVKLPFNNILPGPLNGRSIVKLRRENFFECYASEEKIVTCYHDY